MVAALILIVWIIGVFAGSAIAYRWDHTDHKRGEPYVEPFGLFVIGLIWPVALLLIIGENLWCKIAGIEPDPAPSPEDCY